MHTNDVIFILFFFGLTNWVTIKVGAYVISEIRKMNIDKLK